MWYKVDAIEVTIIISLYYLLLRLSGLSNFKYSMICPLSALTWENAPSCQNNSDTKFMKQMSQIYDCGKYYCKEHHFLLTFVPLTVKRE